MNIAPDLDWLPPARNGETGDGEVYCTPGVLLAISASRRDRPVGAVEATRRRASGR